MTRVTGSTEFTDALGSFLVALLSGIEIGLADGELIVLDTDWRKQVNLCLNTT